MKTIKIGLSCTPSEYMSSEEFPCTEIIITYGGGMGGSRRTEYCTKITHERMDGFLNLHLVDGRNIIVNPKYVVMTEDGTCVKFVTDNLQHVNYHKKCFKKYIQTRYYFIHSNEVFEIDLENYISETENSPKFLTEIDSEKI